MKPIHLFELIAIVLILGLSLVVESYAVREIAAALMIFGILFGAVEATLLILFLIGESALQGVSYLEGRMIFARARHTAASAPLRDEHILRSPRWI